VAVFVDRQWWLFDIHVSLGSVKLVMIQSRPPIAACFVHSGIIEILTGRFRNVGMKELRRVACLVFTTIASGQAHSDDVIESARRPNWSGIYVGGFVGGVTGATTSTTEPVRLDNLTYWFRPFSFPYGYQSNSSAIAGGTIGYNLQISSLPLVVGVEGEYGYLHQSGNGVDVNQILYAPSTSNVAANIGRHWTDVGGDYGYGVLGVRAGYIFDRFLIYVKSGAAFTRIKTAYSSIKREDDISQLPNLRTYSAFDNIGFAMGAGVEFSPNFLENISLKAEYLYLGINNVQRTNGYCSCHFQWMTVDSVGGVHSAKFGLNFRFPNLAL
jgi:outer membrane immunogenic protein